jgi:anti-sigma-K factor RskA
MDCSEADLMLDELALDVLPGDRRAALLAHVEECSNCRRLLDQLTETADGLLLAGPEAAPPPGFEDRVLERIEGAPSRSGRRRRDRAALVRLSAWTAAAAAVVLLVIGGVTGAVIGRSAGGPDESAERFRTVQLISTSGADIGDVSTYTGDPSPWFFMRVENDDVPDATYRCVLDMDDGRTVAIGRLWAVKGHGGWGEHLSVDSRHAVAARLLDPKGATVGTARFR